MSFKNVRSYANATVLDSEEVVCNWSKTNVLSYSKQVVYPKDVEEVQSIVKNAKGKIRLIGSGLSYEPIHSIISEDPNAILMDIKNINGLIDFQEDRVTYRAGSQLDDVYAFLISNDKMLPCSPGVIGIQTIGGAISTGTHGQGLNQSSLGDTVLSLKIVLPSGELSIIDATHPQFGAFLMSMGCLGVIVEVTLSIVPNVIYTCKKITTNYENLCELFEQMNHDAAFAKAWWFSWTNEVMIWSVKPASSDELELYNQNHKQLTNVSDIINNSMNQTIDKVVVKMGYETKDTLCTGRQFETVTRFKSVTDVTGNVYQILCKGIPVPQINCEIAVPFERMIEVLDALGEWQRTTKLSLHYPFILRCTGSSKAYLNPAYNRKVCYIGFLVYLAKDGSFIEGSMEMMAELQQILAKYDGLPHLGKHFVKSYYNFTSILPKWNEFIQLKQTLDPTNKFSNQFMDQFFEQNEHLQTPTPTPGQSSSNDLN